PFTALHEEDGPSALTRLHRHVDHEVLVRQPEFVEIVDLTHLTEGHDSLSPPGVAARHDRRTHTDLTRRIPDLPFEDREWLHRARRAHQRHVTPNPPDQLDELHIVGGD